MFVYAASSNDPVLTAENAYRVLNKKETSSFECSDCGSHMHVVSSVSPEPYCISCGTDRVIESNRKVPETAAFMNDNELASVHCTACDTQNVMPANAVKAAKQEVHCVLCGTGLQVVNSESTEDVAEDETTPAVTESESVASAEDSDEEMAMGDDEEMAMGEDEFPELPAMAMSEEDDSGEEIAMDADMPVDQEYTEEYAAGDLLDGYGGEEPGVKASDMYLDDKETDGVMAGDQGLGLLDALELDDTTTALSFSAQAGVLIARKGAHTVAFATPASANQDADTLMSKGFEQAVFITAGTKGVRKALASYGFKQVKVKPVDSSAVNKGVAKARSEFASLQAKKDQVFADSIAIAAAGFARNLWRDAKNPLKAALEAQFATTMSPRNAKLAATKILTQHGLEYSKSLVSYATKLASMTATARKEYADMLDLVSDDAEMEYGETDDTRPLEPSYPSSEEAMEEDIGEAIEDMGDVTARLSTAALLRAPRGSYQNSVTAGSNRDPLVAATEILAGRAPLGFSA